MLKAPVLMTDGLKCNDVAAISSQDSLFLATGPHRIDGWCVKVR